MEDKVSEMALEENLAGKGRMLWWTAGVGFIVLSLGLWLALGHRVSFPISAEGRNRRSEDHGQPTVLSHRDAKTGGNEELALSAQAVFRLGLPISRVASIERRWKSFRNGEIVWDWRVGRKITFTFDDGPNPRTTPLLLENLERAGVRATFFVVGRRIGGRGPNASKSRQVLREEVRRGHLVGLHSYTHPMMIELSHKKQKWEILATQRAVEKTVGLRPYLYRPPFGGRTRYSEGVLRANGYSVVMWNMSTGDPFGHSPAKVLNTAMKKIRRHQGGVLLMHDTYGWSAAALPLIVRMVLIESCTLLARGEQPYLVVGLEQFWIARGASSIRQTPAMRAEAQRWLVMTRKLCGMEQDKRRTP